MMADILRMIVIIEGAALLVMAFLSFVHRKVTESIALSWGGFAVIMILVGAIPALAGWSSWIPPKAVPAFVLISAAMLLGVFYISCAVSQLIRKNQELAMHVSLLNQENESILEELRALREQKE